MAKRRHTRVSSALQIWLGPDADSVAPYWIKNLSISGAYVLTEAPWPTGTAVQLRVDTDAGSLHTMGVVLHAGDDGVGIAFSETDEAFVAGLKEFLDGLIAKGAEADRRRGAREGLTNVEIIWRHRVDQVEARLLDVSPQGALISGPPSPPVDSLCYVYLPRYDHINDAFESHNIVGCVMTVRHSSEEAFGGEFRAPTAEFQQTIEKLVALKG